MPANRGHKVSPALHKLLLQYSDFRDAERERVTTLISQCADRLQLEIEKLNKVIAEEFATSQEWVYIPETQELTFVDSEEGVFDGGPECQCSFCKSGREELEMQPNAGATLH